MRPFLCSLLVASLVCSLGSADTPLPAGIKKGAAVEGITEYDLANGMRVLLFPDASKTTATVNITYLVGSRNEDYGESGMAHLLEHMLFKGSPKHRNIPQELTEHGASPNGTTSWDRTNYFETFQANDVNLKWALDLESDRMVNSFVAKKDLDSEMTVVRNEYESGENRPVSVLFQRVMSAAFNWHNYGKSPIGNRADIENVPIERLQAFYHRFYQPDNAVLTVAGQIDEAKTLALIQSYFGSIPKPARVIQKTYTEEPAQDGERQVTLRRIGDNKVVIVGLHSPAFAHPDSAFVDILADTLGNTPSGRLYRALVDTKKAANVFGEVLDLREPGLIALGAIAPTSANLDDLRDSFLKSIDDVETNPPTEEEVSRSKTKLLKDIDLALSDSSRVGLELSEYAAAGDWRLAFIFRDRIQAATTADIGRVAKAYLKQSNRTVGQFIPTAKPDRAEIPQAPDLVALLQNYKPTQAIAQGEAFDTSTENIDKRTIRGQLRPGIKLALINKKTRGALVRAAFRLHYGNVDNLRDRDTLSTLAGNMLMRGTSKHTRQQLTDQLDKLKARLTIIGQDTGTMINLETTRENLPAVMTLLAETLREPSFSATEFGQLKQQQITRIESMRQQPEAIAFEHAERHISPYPKGDVRYAKTSDEQIADIKAATLEQVKEFYTHFYGANNAELAVIGDFAPEELQKQVSGLFAGWTSHEAYAPIPKPYKEVAAINKSFELPDKPNAAFVAIKPVNITDESPDYPALTLANYMLGGGFLNSRLATRIRVKEGLSYGVGSQVSVLPKEESGTFYTYAISAPQNTAKVEAAFLDELKKAVAQGFTDSEIAAAKSGWLQSRQVSRGQDAELAAQLTSRERWGRTMKFDADIEARVKALKTADVNSALQKYVSPDQISIFKAGDFSKVKKSAPSASSSPSSR